MKKSKKQVQNNILSEEHIKTPSYFAELIVAHYHGLRRDKTSNLFYLYDHKNGGYKLLKPEDNFGIEQLMHDYLKRINQVKHYRLNHIKATINCLTHIQEIAVDMDADNNFILMKNGVFNIKKNKLYKHNPKFNLSFRVEVDYNPKKSNCPVFAKYIVDTFRNGGTAREDLVDLVKVIQEIGGFLLSPGGIREAEKMLILWGEGSNGKSVFINILRNFFPKEQITTLSLSNLIGKPSDFYRADLVRSRLNICSEEKSIFLGGNAELKKIISGETITVNIKNQPVRTIKPKTKILIACNKLPSLGDNTKGGRRRLLIVKFENTFIEAGEYNNLIKKFGQEYVDKRNIFKAIKNIENQIIHELPAIFNFFMGGKKRLEKKYYEFTKAKNVSDSLEQNLQNDSPIYCFLKERYEIDEKSFTATEKLYADFRSWYKDNIEERGLKCPGKNKFSEEVSRVFDIPGTRNSTISLNSKTIQLRGYNLKEKKEDANEAAVIIT